MSCDLGLKMLEVEWEFLSCFSIPFGVRSSIMVPDPRGVVPMS